MILDEHITLYFYSAESLNVDLVKIQVTCCWYKQAHMRVAMFATIRISAPFWGSKSIFFSLFWNKKATFKCTYTLNGVHMLIFFNTESLNVRATHLT